MKDNDFEKLWNSGATARKYSQCSISDHELETIIGNAIERDNKTRKKHFPIWQKPYVYLAMVAACVAAVVVGLWQLRINSVLIPNTSEALQPSPTILVAQTTDKPATITDNEIKNKTATPQPDITATAPIVQEHIPVLLAETEIQTHIEQNLVADTAYMIADAGDVYDVLEMYCSTRCSNSEVSEVFFGVL